MQEPQKTRCFGGPEDPLMMRYHDEEWGVPVHDDRLLFEFLALEGAQAGLSWRTILHKRENYRRAFDNFDAAKVAAYGEADRRRLLADAGIVRNRLKVDAVINNAQRLLAAQKEYGAFDHYIWQFTGRKTLRSAGSAHLRRDARQDGGVGGHVQRPGSAVGSNSVGPTICYAFMQAVGMVNDHVNHLLSGATRVRAAFLLMLTGTA